MEGFAYFHFPEGIPVAAAELQTWVVEGSITMTGEILLGIGRYPEALSFVFNGGTQQVDGQGVIVLYQAAAELRGWPGSFFTSGMTALANNRILDSTSSYGIPA